MSADGFGPTPRGIGGSVLEIERMVGMGDADGRKLETESARKLPAGTTIISSDSHWFEGDLWVDRFPAHLKHKAPRVFYEDGGWMVEIEGRRLLTSGASKALNVFENIEGFRDVDVRLRELDAEGVDKELLFFQKFGHLVFLEDLAVKEMCVRAYNQGLAEFCAKGQGRLKGVAVLNWWDEDATVDALAEIKELGHPAVVIPKSPGKHRDGQPVDYGGQRMEKFWTAIEESGLVVCFHTGEKPFENLASSRGVAGEHMMNGLNGLREVWAKMVFSGLFDRNPTLKMGFFESGLHWVPGALQEADMICESVPAMMQPKLAHPASHYWYRNCFASFMVDPAGLALIDRIGVDNAMWASDYPHTEGTRSYTRSSVNAVFDALSEEDAKKVVGGNAAKMFGF
jgi:predicted TIM-barrel fold metal-dependent hydrolase